MNKLVLALVAISIFSIFILADAKKSDYIKIRLEDRIYKVLIADTRTGWAKGLSGIKKLSGYDGMLFIFPEKQKRAFWNKNTYLDLKLYWLDDDRIVGTSSLPSIKKTKKILSITSPGEVNKVVELVVK